MEGTDEPVAVTGAGGFVGLAVCRRLVADGHEVIGLDLAGGERVEAAGARFEPCRRHRPGWEPAVGLEEGMRAAPKRGSAPRGCSPMAEPPAHYFAYGSNLASRIMAQWCPEAQFLGPARLAGFRLAFLRRSARWKAGAADVVPAAEASVWGALYAVSPADLEALDRKEFVADSGYRRREVVVELDGQPVPAATYEVVDKARDELTPKAEYLALMLEGAGERGLPERWLQELRELPARFGLH